MNSKILINAVDPEECRIAKIKDNKLDEFHIESASKEIAHGNIYKAIVGSVELGLQAAFVDYGAERHGFLQQNEIHSDYFQDNNGSGKLSITKMLKKGQEILVQIVKDPFMKKGAVLTTYISLPGRFLVLMPGSDNKGISRKIEDEDERSRLKDMMNKLKLPEGFGVIVRTAGAECTKTLMAEDLTCLLRLWKSIKDNVVNNKEKSPALLYKERNFVVRSIRDYFTSDVTEILVDDASVHREVKKFLQIISKKHVRNVKLYNGAKPIFTKHQLEDQIASIYESRVSLKSGGSIVIEQTEALVSIDVNSGKAIKQRSVEETALTTNIEAAEEIARQLRLRDLGGLIVMDLIDMRETRHKLEVEKAIKDNVKTDKAKTKIGKISRFGLLEMSRQRLRPSIAFGSYVPCCYCQGKGLVASTETLVISFLRKLRLATLKDEVTNVKGIAPIQVANYLLNKKRKEILDLESRRNLTISIEGNSAMIPGESNIVCSK